MLFINKLLVVNVIVMPVGLCYCHGTGGRVLAGDRPNIKPTTTSATTQPIISMKTWSIKVVAIAILCYSNLASHSANILR